MTIFQTPHFLVRELRCDDAQALLTCYADKTAVSHMNDDNCGGDFYIPDEDSMRRAIEYWERDPAFERLAIVEKESERPIGTIEYHLREETTLVLRVDIAAAFEKIMSLYELIGWAAEVGWERYLMAWRCVIKAHPHSDARRRALEKLKFTGETVLGEYPNYYEKVRPDRGLSYCGLVCAYCSKRLNCVGCKQGDCADRTSCKPFTCCTAHGYASCADCAKFPCGTAMLKKLRPRAFLHYAHEHGEEALLLHLKRKAAQGTQYHRDGLVGDYDGFESEEELIRFLES